jgi:ABC-2 type transport system ATP-binding protein
MNAISRTDTPALDLRNVVKVYGKSGRPALAGLSLTVARGEILGLLGPNGAGKTTAISIMCTLLPPTSGEVRIAGFDVRRQAQQVRQLIGLVPQDIALYPQLTARENLRYFGRMYGLDQDTLNSRSEACLAQMGLTEKADCRIDTYSGGLKRRANLAVGLLQRPAVLFLDEPTVGVDPQSRNMILETLRGLRDSGMTMVYTTHYMEEVQQLCSRIVILDEGRIMAQGALDGLLAAHPDCASLGEVFLKLTGRQLRD